MTVARRVKFGTAAALALTALALGGCSSWGKVALLAVPPGVSDEGLSDAQLRHLAFASDVVMFLGRQRADGIALVPHFRVRHSSTDSYLPQAVSMSTPLHVSTPLIVDRSVLHRDDLCLFLRRGEDGSWRRMALEAPTRRAALASGRIALPPLATLPELR